MFTGFLTLSSFLLTTKVLFVIQLRKDVYDNDAYYKVHSQVDSASTPYSRVKRMSHVLNFNVFLSLAACLSQFTIGFIDNAIATLFCMLIALAAIVCTFYSVYKIRRQLDIMFEWLDHTAENKIEAIKVSMDKEKFIKSEENRPANT